MSKEFSFLCACAGVELTAERIARLAHWNGAGIDWPEFLRLAEHHGVLPLVARNLTAHAQGLPADVDQSLRSEFAKNLRRNLWFASELARISEHFAQKDLRAIPYKGPMLAESVYGDIALRNFGDLDFLISSSDFERGKQALAEFGYRPSKPLSPAVERYWLRNGYECSFDGAAGKYLIELQWGLLPHFYAVDLRTDDLLARSGSMMFSGREVAALSPEDSLLVLCLHAAKHLWMRMIWVCDIAETMRTQVLDWDVIRARARELGILRIVGVSLWLSQRLLGCPLPEPANELVNQDQEVAALGEQFAARLAGSATYDFESTEYFRLILRLRERRSDQARYLWRLLWTPGEGDLAAIRLPEAMFPLYRGVRAVRLLGKLF
ncbi:MAG: nucleotidyltransferase family protein [Acidobacteria bacterium]|nr:nucleotidyltransferase family protein [Acidobacteriota bacterium]